MPTQSGEEDDHHQQLSLRIASCNCNCNVKKEIKPPQWGGKTSKITFWVIFFINSSGHPVRKRKT
jgi:hypothetical protein